MLPGQGRERSDLDDAGDVHRDLDRPELVLDAGDLLLHSTWSRTSQTMRRRVDAVVGQRQDGLVQLDRVARPEHRLEPAPAELAGDEQPEAPRAAGDEGDRSCGHDGYLPIRRPSHAAPGIPNPLRG